MISPSSWGETETVLGTSGCTFSLSLLDSLESDWTGTSLIQGSRVSLVLVMSFVVGWVSLLFIDMIASMKSELWRAV